MPSHVDGSRKSPFDLGDLAGASTRAGYGCLSRTTSIEPLGQVLQGLGLPGQASFLCDVL